MNGITGTTGDLVVRTLAESEARDVFTSLPDPGLVGGALLGRPYTTVHEGGEYRPEWTWVAEREGRVVARAALWAGPADQQPLLIDWFDFEPGEREAAVRLLRGISPKVEFEVVLPPGWRSDPAARAAAEARIDAASEAGWTPLVERFRYRWTPDSGVPEHSGRLRFRPEPDDEVILDVLRQIQHGTLDAHARQALATGNEDGPAVERAAREDMDHLRWMASHGGREWWRLAHTPDGALAGLHVPGLIPSGYAVGFIGVVPQQRGNGYAYDLLAECTRQLAAEGAESVAAATDLGNAPMAAAFAKAGYPVVQHRFCMTPGTGSAVGA
ncbi:GCN5 family acetyltransferase [Streptomyces abyssalis]|uniref:GCN5 family acetyltransferase n=1 Tax=Streptomyces abyssalis TaxID=933944 RepID=A0A1E7JI60_9ACTN|nr:GNAT family N-acetyltransferase [Streptomyces abyssalis]OEU86174.1 GCN5 family acetyltransferase [Streptomyces abyssalis]OEU92363.1 GCN5 family acetyltransferase [Streptomyces abyssalis]